MKPARTGLQVSLLAAAGILLAYLSHLKPEVRSGTDELHRSSQKTPAALVQHENNPAASRKAHTDIPETTPAPDDIIYGLEQPVLGKKFHLREIRLTETGVKDAPIRDMEFLFRGGILPKRLFGNTGHIIVRYGPLQRNVIGSGAVTTRFYYEIVSQDSNGDGRLSSADKHDVAVSFPDGSSLTTLVSAVDEVLDYQYKPVKNSLNLTLRFGDRIENREYSLETYRLVNEGN